MGRRNALREAMGLPSGGAQEEKEEEGEGRGGMGDAQATHFSRIDLRAFNKHYATQSLSSCIAKDKDTASPTATATESTDQDQDQESWCIQQLKAEMEATVPEDALPSSDVLSQDTYQSLRHQQQQSVHSDPHLQVSAGSANSSNANTTSSEFGSIVGSGGKGQSLYIYIHFFCVHCCGLL